MDADPFIGKMSHALSPALTNSISSLISECCGSRSLKAWLEDNYFWPNSPAKRMKLYREFNERNWGPEIDERDTHCFEKTNSMKRTISEQVNHNHLSRGKEFELVKFFIEDWGGITGNKQSTLEGIISARRGMRDRNDRIYQLSAKRIDRFSFDSTAFQDKENNRLQSGGISSWSKYLSIAYPDWAHIYDARVAFTINSIIYLSENLESKIYPIPQGRNSKQNFLDIETLILRQRGRQIGFTITEDSQQTKKEIEVSQYMPKSQLYDTYLDLLSATQSLTSRRVPCDTWEIESFLFVVSDSLVLNEVYRKALSQG